MDLIKVSYDRHVVRHFDNKPLKTDDVRVLNDFINNLNNQYGLHMQLIVNEEKTFGGEKAKMSNITGCVNHLAIVAKPTQENKILAGYVGEQVVLEAQSLGINSCWAALTFDRFDNLYKFNDGEDLIIVVALGYGLIQGKPHKSKTINEVCVNKTNLPKWFLDGVNVALNAPTGKNQQGFMFELIGDNTVKLINKSFCNEVDYGIVKYHFELAAGKENFQWLKNK